MGKNPILIPTPEFAEMGLAPATKKGNKFRKSAYKKLFLYIIIPILASLLLAGRACSNLLDWSRTPKLIPYHSIRVFDISRTASILAFYDTSRSTTWIFPNKNFFEKDKDLQEI